MWRILRGGEAKNDDKGYAEVCGFPLTLSISSGAYCYAEPGAEVEMFRKVVLVPTWRHAV